MGENLISSGENYMITTQDKFPGALNSISILVYNFDSNICKSLKRIGSTSDLLRVIRNYDSESEFLIRCTGLSGQFNILRYRLNRENFMRRIEAVNKTEAALSSRKQLINKLACEPSISSATYSSSDALSVRSIFKGIGAEMILIDSI